MQSSFSNACCNNSNLHCVLSALRWTRLAYQVEPISTRRFTGVDIHIGGHACDLVVGVEHRPRQHGAGRLQSEPAIDFAGHVFGSRDRSVPELPELAVFRRRSRDLRNGPATAARAGRAPPARRQVQARASITPCVRRAEPAPAGGRESATSTTEPSGIATGPSGNSRPAARMQADTASISHTQHVVCLMLWQSDPGLPTRAGLAISPRCARTMQRHSRKK